MSPFASIEEPLFLDQRGVQAFLREARDPRGMRPSDQAVMMTLEKPYAMRDNVAVVSIKGMLLKTAYVGWFSSYDGYDLIQARVLAALADASVNAVVLCIDSPGGMVSGTFDCARAIAAAAKVAGKPIVACADDTACSAAYALACVGDEIVVPDTGAVGSIGVIRIITSYARMLNDAGVDVAVITSGIAKTDGCPSIPIDDESRQRMQADVDYLANVFAEHVATFRSVAVKDLMAMQGQFFLGPNAVKAGLADAVGNLGDAINRAKALAAKKQNVSGARGARANGETKKMNPEMLKALRESLGLGDDATEAEVLAAVAAQKQAAMQAKMEHENAVRAAIESRMAGLLNPAEKAFFAKRPLADLQEWESIHQVPKTATTAQAPQPKQPVNQPVHFGNANGLPADITAIAQKSLASMTILEKDKLLKAAPELFAVALEQHEAVYGINQPYRNMLVRARVQ